MAPADMTKQQHSSAEPIVEQLKGQLTNGAANSNAKATIQSEVRAAERGGTKNVEAHQHYLLGRFHFNRNSEKSADEALAEYQRALELDPSFALAWAGLAETHVWLCRWSSEAGGTGFESHLAKAREGTARALALEPNLPEALGTRASIQFSFDFDWKGAAETLRTVRSLAPADPLPLITAGSLARAKGDTTQGRALFREAVALDPVNPMARLNLAFSLAVMRNFADAEAEYSRIVALNPAVPWAHAGLGLTFLFQGRFEEAAVAAQDDSAEWARLTIVATARWSQKRIPESDAALARLIEGTADTAA